MEELATVMADNLGLCLCMILVTFIPQVTPDRRGQAKHLAYGLLYGMGPTALAGVLGITDVKLAAEWQESFLSSMPGVQQWIKT